MNFVLGIYLQTKGFSVKTLEGQRFFFSRHVQPTFCVAQQIPSTIKLQKITNFKLEGQSVDSLKPRIRPRSLNESFTLAYSRIKPLKRVACNALVVRLSEDFLLVSRGEVSQRVTRQDNQLHFPKVRLEIGRKGCLLLAQSCTTASRILLNARRAKVLR